MKTVLLTRPLDDEDRVPGLLALAGVEVLRAPMIHFAPAPDEPALLAALADASDVDAVLLTSARAIASVQGHLPQDASVVTLAARTREKAVAAGLHVLPVRDAVDGDDLALAMMEHFGSLAGLRFLMVRSDVAEPAIITALRDQGALVEDVVGYRTLPATKVHDDVMARLQARGVDAVVCMSPSAVRALVALVPHALLDAVTRAAPGKTTAAAWEDAGLPAHVVSERPDAESLVRAVLDALAGRSATAE